MQVITPVFSNGDLESFEVVMEAWCVIISAFSGDAQLAAKPRIRGTVINPIQYTMGHHGLAKVGVCIFRPWTHLQRYCRNKAISRQILGATMCSQLHDALFGSIVIAPLRLCQAIRNGIYSGVSRLHGGGCERNSCLLRADGTQSLA